jgi:flagellar hook-associated protein 1 FlgK
MALTNNLRKQIDMPVWEWCRLAPAVSSGLSASCSADNSLYHVTFGRYIYYLQSGATLATTTGLTGFFRYDTISDSYQALAQPPIAPVVYTGIQFAGGQGYWGYVLGSGSGLNTLQIAGLTGKVMKGFDIRITGGTGSGQQRIVTDVSDPTIWDNGTATAVAATPQNSITDSNKNWIVNQWAGYQVRFVSSSGQALARKIMYNSSNTIYFADVAKFAEDPWAWSPVTTIAGSAEVIAAIGTLYQIESSVITVDSNWLVQPDQTSRYVVRGGGIWMISQGATYTMQYYDVLADQWYIRNAGAATSPVTAIGTEGTIVNSGENATVWDRGAAIGTQSTTTLQDTTKNWVTNQWVGYRVRIFSGTGEDQARVVTSNTSNTLTVSAWTTITPDATTLYFIEGFDGGTLTSVGAMTQTGSSTAGTINGSVFTAGGSVTGNFYQGQILSGTGVQSTKTILSAVAECYTTGLVTTVNFAYSNPTTLGIQVGMVVAINSIVGLPGQAGTGVLAAAAAGPTYVTAVGSNTVTLSIAPTTALLNATLQFTTAWVSTLGAHSSTGSLITLASGNTTGLYSGMYITIGTAFTTGAITVGTYVAQVIDATRFTLSQAPTTALTGSGWLMGQGYQTVLMEQLSGVPSGAGTYRVFPSQTVASTTITGRGISTVTDSTKSWPFMRWNNYAIRIKSGTGKGQVRQILKTESNGAVAYTSAAGATNVGAVITVGSTTNLAVNMLLNVTSGTGAFAFGTSVLSITNSTTFVASAPPTVNLSASAVVTGMPVNTLKVFPNWAVAPSTDSVYVIHGDSDKNYFSTATQAPLFIHNIDADMVTTGRQLDRGVARGITAQYSDWEPVALSSAVPVLTVTGGYGYFAGVATTAGSVTGVIATVTYNTAVAAAIFPVGSWITIAGTTPAAYTGTWQVTASSVGSVSFYLSGSPGAISVQGTVGQAASVNLAVGTLASGNWTQIGNATTVTLSGMVPTTFNGAQTVAAGTGATAATYGGYQSAAGATSSGTNITVSSTVGIKVGALPTVTAGTGTFAAGTVVTSITNGTVFVVNTAPSVALSGGASVVTIVPSVAFTSSTAIGTPVTNGCLQINPKASTAMSGAAGTVTVTVAGHGFPVGSWVVVTGAAPGTYNGIYQVTGGTPGTNVTYANATTTTATTQCLIGPATQTMLVTTVNNTNLQTGMTVAHNGDQGFTPSVNNVSGAITVMTPTAGTAATQYTYNTAAPAAQMFVYGQTTTTLCDGTKNWVANQWAGCQVTYNSTQFTTANTQPTILSAFILSNTANTLIFAAAHTTAPVQGVSRYVITSSANTVIGNMLGSQDCGLVQGAQLITQLQDVTKSWIMPAPITGITGTTITVGAATVVITGSMNGILVGMTVAITLGGVSLPLGTVISSISGTTITMSQNFGGAGTTATFTFAATASSSGNTVTVTGYPLTNLAPGMKLAVTSTVNLSSYVVSTGAFVLNGGVNFTPVTVTSITGTNTFTISQTPAVPLQNATVQATFWVPGQWVNRRVRITSGITINNVEAVVTANTTNTLTFATIGTAPTHGTNGYAILQQPSVRGLGTAPFWNYGASNSASIGKYMYQARGGNLPGFDRLNLTTDNWDFLTTSPGFEPLNTGAMYAYDGADRIYFTVQVTQRMYYLDIEKNVIHPAGMYPYVAGTAIVGNRMEIFTTPDGLKYLWLNRHSFQECFRQLLWY